MQVRRKDTSNGDEIGLADGVYSPPEAYWTLSATPQACVNEVKHLLAAGCINTTTDFIILLVPIPYVRRLKLPREQQIVVGGLFAGGIFVTAAGAARTVVTFLAFSDPKGDITWNAIPVTIASALELFVGIVSSLPTPPLPKKEQKKKWCGVSTGGRLRVR